MTPISLAVLNMAWAVFCVIMLAAIAVCAAVAVTALVIGVAHWAKDW